MTPIRALRRGTLLALGLAGAVLALGCAEAKADRVDVTYYYLPG